MLLESSTQNRSRLIFFIILCLGLIPLAVPFIQPGHPLAHDREIPYMRTLSLDASLREGQFPPRWFPEFDGGYGSPYPSFYAMLFYWATMGIHAFGLPLGASLEVAAFLTIFLSAVFMFFFIRDLWGDLSGVFAAILYSYAPFHLVDAFVRGAYSELTAFVWFPLILHNLYKWLQSPNRRSFIFATLSISGLLLTHNLMSFVFLPMAFLIPILATGLKGMYRSRCIVGYGLIWAIGFMLTAFFWMPILFESQFVHLTDFLRYDYAGDFVPVRALLLPTQGYAMATEIGPVLILAIGLALALVLIYRRSFEHRRLYFVFFGMLSISLFMTTRYSKFVWDTIPILAYVQFPWRILAPASFMAAILAAPLPRLITHRLLSTIAVICLTLASMVVYRELITTPNSFASMELERLRTCEEVWGTQDYRPRWSNVPFWRGPKHPEITGSEPFLQPCEGRVTISDEERVVILNEHHGGTLWEIEYHSKGMTGLSIPQFYYPGWEASVGGEHIEIVPTADEGLIGVTLPEGNHILRVEFKETKIRKVSNVLSLLACVSLIAMYLSQGGGTITASKID